MIIPSLVHFGRCKLTDDELRERVAEHLEKMYKNVQLPPRNIPARPDEDFDLLLGELLVRFEINSIQIRYGLERAYLAGTKGLDFEDWFQSDDFKMTT